MILFYRFFYYNDKIQEKKPKQVAIAMHRRVIQLILESRPQK